MPIWTNPSISDTPAFELVFWAVFEVQLGAEAPPTRHVVGEVSDSGDGQVSSPVIEFDPGSGSFRTRSGRVYRVLGSPLGLRSQGDYVWKSWLSLWKSEFEPREVTDEVAQAIAERNGEPTYESLCVRLLREHRLRRDAEGKP